MDGVAERVETQEQLDQLRQFDCDIYSLNEATEALLHSNPQW